MGWHHCQRAGISRLTLVLSLGHAYHETWYPPFLVVMDRRANQYGNQVDIRSKSDIDRTPIRMTLVRYINWNTGFISLSNDFTQKRTMNMGLICVFISKIHEKCLRFHIVDGRFPKSFCLLMNRNIDFYHSFLICISSFCGNIWVFKVHLCQMYIQHKKY